MRGSNHGADYFNRRPKTNRWGPNPCMEGQLDSGIVERASIRRSQAGPSHPIRPSRPSWLQMRVRSPWFSIPKQRTPNSGPPLSGRHHMLRRITRPRMRRWLPRPAMRVRICDRPVLGQPGERESGVWVVLYICITEQTVGRLILNPEVLLPPPPSPLPSIHT